MFLHFFSFKKNLVGVTTIRNFGKFLLGHGPGGPSARYAYAQRVQALAVLQHQRRKGTLVNSSHHGAGQEYP